MNMFLRRPKVDVIVKVNVAWFFAANNNFLVDADTGYAYPHT